MFTKVKNLKIASCGFWIYLEPRYVAYHMRTLLVDNLENLSTFPAESSIQIIFPYAWYDGYCFQFQKA